MIKSLATANKNARTHAKQQAVKAQTDYERQQEIDALVTLWEAIWQPVPLDGSFPFDLVHERITAFCGELAATLYAANVQTLIPMLDAQNDEAHLDALSLIHTSLAAGADGLAADLAKRSKDIPRCKRWLAVFNDNRLLGAILDPGRSKRHSDLASVSSSLPRSSEHKKIADEAMEVAKAALTMLKAKKAKNPGGRPSREDFVKWADSKKRLSWSNEKLSVEWNATRKNPKDKLSVRAVYDALRRHSELNDERKTARKVSNT